MIDSLTHHRRAWLRTIVLLILIGIAAALRLWRLDSLPAGLHFDEAAYGLQAQQILRGETPVFFSNYAGREALFQYTVAPFVAALGPTILAVRLPAALWSIALVPVMFALGTRMYGWRAGLFAALATACGPWLVHIGRIGYRTNTLPIVSALAIYALYRALADQRRGWWIGAGALCGLCMYTYAVVRVLPLLGPLLLMYLLIWHRDLLRRSASGIGLFTIVLALVVMPWVVHMIRVPSDLLERFGQVSVTQVRGDRSALILANLRLMATMWGVRGVEDDFLRLAWRPIFAGIAALPFYAGLLLAIARVRRLAYGLTLLWLAVMLIPVALASDTHIHWIHAIGAAPPAYLLWGLGMIALIDGALWLLKRRFDPRRAGSVVLPIVLVIATAWWTQATAREYFGVWAVRPDVYYDFMQYATDAATTAAQVPDDRALLISEDYYRHATYLYLVPQTARAQWYDARHAVVWPRSAPWTAFVSASTPSTDDLLPLLAQARGEPYAPDGLFSFMRLDGDSVPPFEPPRPWQAGLGDLLDLRGYAMGGSVEPGAALHVQLWAEARGSTDRELRWFVHLEDDAFRVVAQDDALGYDSREWQRGDRFMSFHTLSVPADQPPAKLRLVIGLYDVATGQRVPVAGDGAHGDFIELPLP